MLLKVDYLINNKEKKITCLFYKRTFYKNEKKQDIKIQLSRLNSVQSEHISTVKKQYVYTVYCITGNKTLCKWWFRLHVVYTVLTLHKRLFLSLKCFCP